MANNKRSDFEYYLPKYLKKAVPEKLIKQINQMESDMLQKKQFADLIIEENQCLVKQIEALKEKNSQNIVKLKEKASLVVQQLLDDTCWYRKNSEEREKSILDLELAYRRKTVQLNLSKQKLIQCEEQNVILKNCIETYRKKQDRIEMESKQFRTAYTKLKETIRAFSDRIAKGKYIVKSNLDVEALLKSLIEEVECMKSDITTIDTALSTHGIASKSAEILQEPKQSNFCHMVPMSEYVKRNKEKKMWQNRYLKLEKEIKETKNKITSLNECISNKSVKYTRLNLKINRCKYIENELRIAQAQLKRHKSEIEELQRKNTFLAQWKAKKLRQEAIQPSTSKSNTTKDFLSCPDLTLRDKALTSKTGKFLKIDHKKLHSPNSLSRSSSCVRLHIPSDLTKESGKHGEAKESMTFFFKNIFTKVQKVAQLDTTSAGTKNLLGQKESFLIPKTLRSVTMSPRDEFFRNQNSVTSKSKIEKDKITHNTSLLFEPPMVQYPQLSTLLKRSESIKSKEFLKETSIKLQSKSNYIRPSLSTSSINSVRTLNAPILKSLSNSESINATEERKTFKNSDSARLFLLGEKNYSESSLTLQKDEKDTIPLTNTKKEDEKLNDIKNADFCEFHSVNESNPIHKIGMFTEPNPTVLRLSLSKNIGIENKNPKLLRANNLLKKYLSKKSIAQAFTKD